MNLWRVLLLLAVVVAAQEPSPPATEVEAAAEVAADAESDGVAVEEEISEEEAIEEPVEAEAEMEAAPPPAASNKASMQWVVTAKMRARLGELGYSEDEVAALDPQRASAIIKHAIARPSKGVPAGWNRGARKSGGNPVRSAVLAGRSMLAKVGGVPNPVLVPAVLILGGLGALKTLGGGGGAVASAAVAAALSDPVDEPPDTGAAPVSDELWLDRQIDKLIAVLKMLIGR